jgi:hypothetical protein
LPAVALPKSTPQKKHRNKIPGPSMAVLTVLRHAAGGQGWPEIC